MPQPNQCSWIYRVEINQEVWAGEIQTSLIFKDSELFFIHTEIRKVCMFSFFSINMVLLMLQEASIWNKKDVAVIRLEKKTM